MEDLSHLQSQVSTHQPTDDSTAYKRWETSLCSAFSTISKSLNHTFASSHFPTSFGPVSIYNISQTDSVSLKNPSSDVTVTIKFEPQKHKVPKKSALRSTQTRTSTHYPRLTPSQQAEVIAAEEIALSNLTSRPSTKDTKRATKSALSFGRFNARSARTSEWISRSTQHLLIFGAIGITVALCTGKDSPFGGEGDVLNSALSNTASLAWSAAKFVGSCGWSAASGLGRIAGSAASEWWGRDSTLGSVGSRVSSIAGMSAVGSSVSGFC